MSSLLPGLVQAQTPAGTPVVNTVTGSFTDPAGNGGTLKPDTSVVVIGQWNGVEVEPPQVVYAAAGSTLLLSHTVRNTGNATDTYTLSALSQSGWPLELYIDVNGDGLLDASDLLLVGGLTLEAGATVSILLVAQVPGSFSGGWRPNSPDQSEYITVTAVSTQDASVTDSVVDEIRPLESDARLVLSKSVDRAEAGPSDVLTYTVSWVAAGGAIATDVEITDVVPAGTLYVPGSLTLNGQPLSDAADGDAGSVADGTVRVRLGEMPGGSSGSVTFQARVAEDVAAGSQILNTALISYTTASGTAADSASAATNITTPEPGNLDVSLTKQVDRVLAQSGDLLTYSILYSVSGTGTAELVIADVLPAGVVYEAGTLRLNGQSLTDAEDSDAGAASAGGVSVRVGTVQPGASGTVTFQVRVAAGTVAGTQIQNVAGASWTGDVQGEGDSNPVVTEVAGPELELDKRVVGDTLVKVGDEVVYRIVARNPSSVVTLRNLVVTDSLPAGLELVSTTPAQNGGSWSVAALAPGDSVVFTVVARVLATATSGASLVNRAQVTADDGAGGSDDAVVVVVQDDAPPPPPSGEQFEVALRSTALEICLSESLLLVGDVRNSGTTAVTGVEVQLALPAGTRFVPESLSGAEFVSESGGVAVVRLPGTLQPGATASFTYTVAVVSAESETLLFGLVVRGLDGQPLSNEAIAAVRIACADTTVVIGRVWVDLNGNGRQDDGEPGVGGVDVWSEDGSVSRTDELGKFSFVNLRLGRHAFRADPATIPDAFAPPPNEDGIVVVNLTGWNTLQVLLPLWTAEAVRAYHEGGAPAVAALREAPGSGALVSGNGNGVSVRMLPVGEAADTISLATDSVRVAPARTDEERTAEEQAALFSGPPVRIEGALDGLVVGRDRLPIRAQGEPGMPLTLFQGDSLITEARARGDGSFDFSALKLEPGPNMIRLRAVNSWGQERWDSVMVHLSGRPARFELDSAAVVLPADGRTTHSILFRVLDAWGVPTVNGPYVTVEADEAVVTSVDAYRSSLGVQVQADDAGWALADFRSGDAVARGQLRLRAGDLEARIPVDQVASVLPLMVVGTGQIGIGAAPDAFGAVTARGRVAEGTSLTVSWDSRRLDDGRGVFGRAVDPFSEGIYPILGDASERRVANASRSQLAARLERGFDFIAAGDIQTTLGPDENSLVRYSRSLTGAAASIGTGALQWTGFGAMSSQALRQVQLRGLGTSGPYIVDASMIAGTEQVYIEARDRDNAQNVVTRRRLTPFVDYQVDYRNGTILLKQPLPAADTQGNPLFLVVTSETRGGGQSAGVFGARVQADMTELTGAELPGAVLVGASVVHDGQGLAPLDMLAADVRYAPASDVELRAELARSAFGDSAGVAANVSGRAVVLNGRISLRGQWSRMQESFRNPSNVALVGASQDLSAGAGLRVLNGEVSLEHSRQEFEGLGITRSRTAMRLRQPFTRTTEFEARLTNDEVLGGTLPRSGGAGEVKLTWSPLSRLRLWGESRSQLWSGDTGQGTGDYFGAGMSVQFMRDLALEARHLQVSAPDGADYSVTNLGLKSTVLGGTQAWGSYQLVGGIDGATNAALVGLNHRLALGDGWRFNGLFERRVGLDRAPVDEPVRALPFLRPESDYWSTGLGVEYMPSGEPYRLSAKGEYKSGEAETFSLGTVAGDVALGGSFALLGRQEFMQREAGPAATSSFGRMERRASILGLAMRPAGRDDVNALLEFRWLVDRNPRGSNVLSQQFESERLIGAAELLWAPLDRLDLGARYAVRSSRTGAQLAAFPNAEVRSDASYLGARADLELTRWLGARAEARLLSEHRSGARVYDVAPAAVLHAIQGVELSAGYRFGDLRDQDFAANGGQGFFMTMGLRVTETTLPTVAAFWRSRFGADNDSRGRADQIPAAASGAP